MNGKERLSASVDAELLDAGRGAVSAGEVDSLSAWVNEALRRQVGHDRRLRAMDDFLAAFEGEHGELTDDEVRGAVRRARERAVIVRGDQGDRPADRQSPGAA